MANNTLQSDIFKFVALRPPVSADKKKQAINFIEDGRKPEETPPGILTRTFTVENAGIIPEQIKTFIMQKEYDLNYPSGNSANVFSRINDFVKTIDSSAISNNGLTSNIETILDQKISEYLNSQEAQAQLDEIWDRYYTFFMLGKSEPQNLETLTQNLRVYHLLELLIKPITISNQATLNAVLAAKPMVPKLFTDLPRPKQEPSDSTEVKPTEAKPTEAQVKEYKKVWADLVDTSRAIEEIKTIRFDTKTSSETKKVKVPNKETGEAVESKLTVVKSKLVVNPSSFAGLHQNTKAILSNLNIEAGSLQVMDTMNQLQTKLVKTNLAIRTINDPRFIDYMPAEAKLLPGIASVLDKFNPADIVPYLPYKPPTNVRKSIKPLGIGDLKVVKQKLLKYAAGEVAHIENVLRGENKERKHRVLDRTEDILTLTNETDEETTKDTQTTERFELKRESEKTVQEQMSVQAGVTVSGSYGMVTFGAHGDFAYSMASSESNKSSSNFAKEVIDKSVSRIQKKTKEERITRKLHEVEEINTHGIDNRGQPDHVTGIYRWVDKHYEAQIYNYGRRMMFEFIIPEPAAFYEYALTHTPKIDIVEPKPPLIKTPKEIDENNYQDYIAEYNVQGVTPPPLYWKTVSTSITKDKMPADGTGQTASSKELVVPAGYVSKRGVWFDCSAYFHLNNLPILEVTIGNKIFRLVDMVGAGASGANAIDTNYKSTDPFHLFWEGNPIQISVNSYDIISYTLNAYVAVERTSEALDQWKIQTFEKIMAAYKALRAEYEQKMAAREVQTGVVIHGQNPGINREIEKTELKKHCVKLLLDTYLYGTFDAMKQSGDVEPDFDIFDAVDEGRTIQFFEQAFEWENITYLFYPYFWGRHPQWIHKMNTWDIDPLFTKFLQAGSAKVVLPVHPAYNDAVMYFLENNGALWSGGETPRLNDPMFLSIADELRNQTDDLAGAVPEGKPWEVVLPTTLVWLQPDDKLPTFE